MSDRTAQEQSFLSEMDQDTDAMQLRLIYADWLEEQNDPRANLVRQLVDFHEEKTNKVDLSDPGSLWSALRAFAPPRDSLDQFSDFQKRMMPVWQKLWMRIGLRTSTTNRSKAESLVRELYRHAEEEEPNQIDWFESPADAYWEALTISDPPEVDFIEWFSTEWPHSGFRVGNSLQGQVSSFVSDRAGTIIGPGVSEPVREKVHERLGLLLEAEELRVEEGAWTAGRLSFLSFFHHVCGLPVPLALQSEFQLALEVTLWFPFYERVLITEKPEQLVLYDEHVCFISWRDGVQFEWSEYEIDQE